MVLSLFEMVGNSAPLIMDRKFTQTKHNTDSKRAHANLIYTPPFGINVSIYVTFRAERSYITSRARNCIVSVILVFSYVVMYGKETAEKFLMQQNIL